MDLDEVLGALEAKPLGEQYSELAKNDPYGVPMYVRGVVMTKAHYDVLLRNDSQVPQLRYDSSRDAFYFGKWTITGEMLANARQPSRGEFVHYDEAPLRKKKVVSKASKRPAAPQWWDEGGWD